MSTETIESTAEVAVKRRPINTDIEINLDAVAEVTGHAFARTAYVLPDDHPLMILYRRSLDRGVALDIPTNDPRSVIALLRRVAAQKKNGMRIDKGSSAYVSYLNKVEKARAEGSPEPEAVPYSGHVRFQTNAVRASGRGRRKTEDASE